MSKRKHATQKEWDALNTYDPIASKSYNLVPDNSSQPIGERSSSTGVLLFSVMVFVVALSASGATGVMITGSFNIGVVLVSFVFSVLAVMSVHIAQQWERVIVLRLGRFNRIAGPGMFFTIPFVEQIAMRVDCRVRATTFGAEETLTSDLVPMCVNAVLLWMVYDAKAACNEVSDFTRTVELAAQSALRDAIGRLTAAEVAMRREQLDCDIKKALEDEASEWGVAVLSVKVRDILLPTSLHDVMSLEAQAEQRRKARIILMEAEQDILTIAEEVGEAYGGEDVALRLRIMHLLYESIQEGGGAVVVPSSFSEGFGDVLSDEMKKNIANKL